MSGLIREFALAKKVELRSVRSILAMPDPDITAELVEEVQETGLVDFLK